MTRLRALLIAVGCCAGAAWLAGPTGRLLVVLPLLLLAPGFLLAGWLRPTLPFAALTAPVLWLGLSLSAVPLLYQWATALGLRLTLPVLAGLMLGCALLTLWRLWRLAGPPAAAVGEERRLVSRETVWLLAPLLAVFGLTLWLRFQQIAGLSLPAWVDSVHHALLIRVAAEQGQAPYSLRPYLPIDQLGYHWGYHVWSAAVMQLAGLGLADTMLWGGQVLNALHVLSGATLAVYLWRRRLAGLVAGLTIGLISIMPAYYVSWGRYTQLEGLLLLPPLAICWDAALRVPTRGRWACATLLLAGLSLIHMRVLIFALCLLGALSLAWALRQGRAAWLGRLRGAALAGGLALLLTLPWQVLLLRERLAPALGNPAYVLSEASYGTLSTGVLWAGQNRLLVALALLAALAGLWRRNQRVAVLLVWVGSLVTLANPWLVGYLAPGAGVSIALAAYARRRWLLVLAGLALLLLNPRLVQFPYTWLINNDAVVISLFVPLALLVGGGAAWLYDWLAGPAPLARRRRLAQGLGVVLLLLSTAWGATALQGPSSGVLNQSTVLATPADLTAITWVEQHTPPDARFLINATGWLPGAPRGVDGGWWLLPLAGRWTSTPPVISSYGSYAYARATLERSQLVADFQPGQQAALERMIAQERIGYIYLTDRSGPLTRATFADPERFQTIYRQDDVTILAVLPQS